MNVVLVVVDSLRPDHLGCYGYGRPTSPQIDGLAAESIVYENAQAPSSWTWPSVASIFTGCWPPTHGVEDRDRCFLSDSLETLAERFSERSCTTFGVTANPLVSHTKNFNQGFEELLEEQLDAAPIIGGKFREFLRRYGGYQFFAYVHFTDPHRPYNPPERFATQFTSAENATAMRHKVNEIRSQRSAPDDPARAKPAIESEADALPDLPPEAIVGLYDGEIACVDFEIGRMIRALEDERLIDRTVFVVTGAHGEVIGAGPAGTGGSSLARDLLHVPLVIRDPRQQPRRERGVVDLTLLAPTLAHAAFADPRAITVAGTPRNDGGPATIPAPAPMMAPWSERPPASAFAHTARGIVAGKKGPCELVAITKDSGRITMTADGEILEFVDLRPDGSSGAQGADLLRAGLGKELGRWLAECRRRAVSRPFERMDYSTQTTLKQMGDD